ncbi:MAG: hypothetical protein WD851_15260 [Pirellulales bacterium]
MALGPLTVAALQLEAATFAALESMHPEPSLFGVTDGKAVGTYLEHKFRATLLQKYVFSVGSSAKGIDFPDLDVDLKVTSIRQPQSSCPFKHVRQKIYGLGYSVLIFVYDKRDEPQTQTATLDILHVIFVEKHRTGDFQMTRGLREILDNQGNKDDLMAFMFDRNLPFDDVTAGQLADELLESHPEQGYLTISNALQWRLQYGRVIANAGAIDGILRVV